MATLDEEQNEIVLRIVYDGPAAAGKTTSVRALGASVGRPVITPEEASERTLYFDWLEYEGGDFEGRALRCQVITVPGQSLLARRRRALLASADAVVYVTPVSDDGLGGVVRALDELHGALSVTSVEQVGVVLQANMRDLPESASAESIRDALDEAGLRVGVVETTATRGTGVTQAFVFAVRLALDRVRAQMEAGTIGRGKPAIDSPQALHEMLRVTELERPYGAAARAITPSPFAAMLAKETRLAVPGDVPLGPDERVASGLVWPPIDGRVVLREATLAAPRIARVDGGYAATSESGYRLYSLTGSAFDDLETGRASLLAWARVHAALGETLSAPRSIALAEEGAGRYRLWQIVRTRPSLRERLATVLGARETAEIAAALLDAAMRLTELAARVSDAGSYLPVTLDSAGVQGDETRYVGLVPEVAQVPRGAAVRVLEELRPLAADFARHEGILRGVEDAARSYPPSAQLRATVARLADLLRAHA